MALLAAPDALESFDALEAYTLLRPLRFEALTFITPRLVAPLVLLNATRASQSAFPIRYPAARLIRLGAGEQSGNLHESATDQLCLDWFVITFIPLLALI